jgi:predicted permease
MQSTGGAGGMDSVLSYPMLRDLERLQTPFTGIAGHRTFSANLTAKDQPMSAEGLLVSGSYFPLLGLQPAAGRLFQPDDDVTADGHPIAVLAYNFWLNQFEGSVSAINQPITINGQLMTIVGVAPRGFQGTSVGQDPKVFVPLAMQATMIPGFDMFENRTAYWVYAFARLKPDTTLEQATTAINIPYSSLIQEVELPLQTGMSDQTKERFAAKLIALEPGARGQSEMLQEAAAPLLQLLAVTILVLLLACANIANLLLNKAINRTGEIAVRMSVGARRHHLIAQLLTESFVLAALGGVFGFWVAKATIGLILWLLPAEAATSMDFGIGPATWIFLGVLSGLTGLLGLFPAWHSTRTELVSGLKTQSGRTSRSKTANRFRTVMATAQIALSTTLLISAGLFIKSLHNISQVDLGIEVEQLATFGVSPQLNAYTPERSRALFMRLEEELAALPGVSSVTASMVPLISGSNWGTSVWVEGFSTEPDVDRHTNFNRIGPGYFSTLGVPLLQGRELTASDTLEAPKVALVNQAFAAKFGLGNDGLGKRVATGRGDNELDIEIVGLVPDVKYSGVKDPVPSQLYMPYRQDERLGAINFYVRAQAEPDDLLPALRGVVARLEPNLPVENLRTMPQQIQRNVFIDRLMSILSASFAILATLLAAIGLYGVVAYRVGQRTREIGLRMAMGADSGSVRFMVLRQVLFMTLPGVVLGAGAAFGLGRLARSLLFEMQGNEPMVFALAIVLLTLVAMIAGAGPAERAARINPILALRED